MRKVFEKVNFNFMGLRWFFIFLSISLITFGMYSWYATGDSKYSVDFLGGTELIVKFDEKPDPSKVRAELEGAGLVGITVQEFEQGSNEFTIRLRGESSQAVATQVSDILKKVTGKPIQILKQDYVGPTIGDKILQDAIVAIIISLVVISMYVTFRFEWAYALGAGVSLLHDVLITAGIFVFLGGEVGAGFLAAILTIVGYSINDTIIVYDRVRENVNASRNKEQSRKVYNGKQLSNMSLLELMNLSINQTLSRTVLTNMTVLVVVLALVQFGGGALADLSNSLLIGSIVGTYSSIFIACPIVLAYARSGSQKVAA